MISLVFHVIISDKNHHIIVKVIGEKIVSSCVCVIIPNLTRNIRPHALIENREITLVKHFDMTRFTVNMLVCVGSFS